MTTSYPVRHTFGTQSSGFPYRPPYQGLYINLDRSPDRRERMEAQLRSLNLERRYRRFAAVDGQTLINALSAAKAGENACFRSHYQALESVKSGSQMIHILEDDAVLSPQLEHIISSFEAGGMLDYFDIVFTETAIGLDLDFLKKYKQLFDLSLRSQPPKFTVLDITQTYLSGSVSYLVPAAAIEKVLSVTRRGIDAGPVLPFDIFLREEAKNGGLRLGCIFPFVTTLQLGDIDQTTIRAAADTAQLSREIMSLLRYSFFVGRDLERVPPSLTECLHAYDGDSHHRLISSVLGFVVSSGEFSRF